MGTEEAVKTEEPKKDDGLKQCSRCGWTTKEIPEPNKEDLKEFMRCMLGLKPYVKLYPFYDGAGKVMFTTLTAEDTDQVNRCIMNCGKNNELDVKTFSYKTKLLFMQVSLELNKNKTDYAKPDFRDVKDEVLAKAVEDEYSLRFGTLPDPVQQIVVRSMILFNDLQNMLTGAALDVNFWKAAGPY